MKWKSGRCPFTKQKKQKKETNMITKTATFGGAFLVVVGLLGFAAPGFMGMHLSALHNILLIFSGVWAIYFALKATEAAARSFCLVLGAVYGLLGLAGFVAGGPNHTFTIIPGALVLGTMDHVVHLVLGTVFLSVGWGSRAVAATPPTR
jgi:uncharacterized membrane protein HdeD (DUF308 family)